MNSPSLLGSQPEIKWGMAADLADIYVLGAWRCLAGAVVAIAGCLEYVRRVRRSPLVAIAALVSAEILARLLFPAEEPYWEYARELRLVVLLAAGIALQAAREEIQGYACRGIPVLAGIATWLMVKLSWVAGGVSLDGIVRASDLERRIALAAGMNLIFPLAVTVPLVAAFAARRTKPRGSLLAIALLFLVLSVAVERVVANGALLSLGAGRAGVLQGSWFGFGVSYGLAGWEGIQCVRERHWLVAMLSVLAAAGAAWIPMSQSWVNFLHAWVLFV